eukprot:6089016-Heterocapsa_arctica.AAC.1
MNVLEFTYPASTVYLPPHTVLRDNVTLVMSRSDEADNGDATTNDDGHDHDHDHDNNQVIVREYQQ